MYQPLTASVENEGQLKAALWTKTLVPGGARGVALKMKFPLMAAWAEMFGFVREERISLRVITDWVLRQSHSLEGNFGSKEASLAQK